ncbi:hypothetical protein [Corallococcus sicarius]|uniref:hypothetical protein n=1 Tax=Corallococcus sicarius TaxID=2316726 RepID=UPI0011C35F23|nr:hypothetical protein [Corallococcus sicarius]
MGFFIRTAARPRILFNNAARQQRHDSILDITTEQARTRRVGWDVRTQAVEVFLELWMNQEMRALLGRRIATLERMKALELPGIQNALTMPIRARVDMLTTGIRTPVGVKLFGDDLARSEEVGREIEARLREVPGPPPSPC